jgi:hypothetical protein
MLMSFLVLHDADAIQGYVFATERLREIRGASALIDRVNRRETASLIGAYKRKGKRVEKIYVGGGGVAATFEDQSSAEEFCLQVSRLT